MGDFTLIRNWLFDRLSYKLGEHPKTPVVIAYSEVPEVNIKVVLALLQKGYRIPPVGGYLTVSKQETEFRSQKRVQRTFSAGGSRGCPPLQLITPKGWGSGGLKRSYETASEVSTSFKIFPKSEGEGG